MQVVFVQKKELAGLKPGQGEHYKENGTSKRNNNGAQ